MTALGPFRCWPQVPLGHCSSEGGDSLGWSLGGSHPSSGSLTVPGWVGIRREGGSQRPPLSEERLECRCWGAPHKGVGAFLLSPWDATKRGGCCGPHADGPLSPPGSLRTVLHAETLPLCPAAVPQAGRPPGPQEPLQAEGDGDPPRPRRDAPLRPHRGEGEEPGAGGWDLARLSPPSPPRRATGAVEHPRRTRVRRGRCSVGLVHAVGMSPPCHGLQGTSAWQSRERA